MGMFTWTDARNENPVKNKRGEYNRRDVLEYGSFGKIVCPDGTEICEENYEGYGRFGAYDAYELVVDWNREHLEQIFAKKFEEKSCDSYLKGIIERLAAGISKEELIQKISEMVSEGSVPAYLINDWKRVIGIAMACKAEDNSALPYPLKIITTRKKIDYDDLYPSISTQ